MQCCFRCKMGLNCKTSYHNRVVLCIKILLFKEVLFLSMFHHRIHAECMVLEYWCNMKTLVADFHFTNM